MCGSAECVFCSYVSRKRYENIMKNITKGADLNKSTSKDTQDTTKEQKVEDTKEVQNV